MEDSIRTTPPAGAPKVAACVSIRPEVQPEPGLVPECSARSTRCPAPSWKTLAVLLVIVSVSPVPKLLPGPGSYFQFAASTPVPAAPLKSSLQVRVKPAGGAPTAALAFGEAATVKNPATATVATTTAAAETPARSRRL